MLASNKNTIGIFAILCIILCTVLTSCEGSKEELPLEFQEFKAYIGTKPQELSRLRPSFLEEFGRHGHTLDAMSLEAQQQEIELLKQQQTTIASLPPLPDSLEQIQREAQLWAISMKIAQEPYLLYENPLNPVTGFHVRLLQTFHDQQVATKEETEAYNARMKMVPRQIQEVIGLLKARHEAGIQSPRLLLEASKKQIEDFLAIEVLQNPLYRGLAIKLNQVNPTELNLYQAGDYLEVAEINLNKFVNPAYEKLLPIIDELLEDAPETLSPLPESDSYYAHQLYSLCGKEIQPDQLFAQGELILDSLQLLIEEYEVQIGKRPTKLSEEQTRKSNRLEQVQIFAAKMRNTREQMIGLFDSLPERSPEIMAKPAYLQNESILVYEPASLDQVKKSRVVVDLEAWKKANSYDQIALLCSQIYPGLFTLDHRNNKEASYISPDGFLAWRAGWENYALRLADQPLYFFSAEVDMKIQFLQGQAKLITQMLLDIGLHHKNWSPEEVDNFVQTYSPKLISDLDHLLVQSYSNPGALVAPWVGAQEFQRLANYTQERFEGKITVKDFHEISTKNGPLPWFLLQKCIPLYENRSMAR